MSTPMYDIPEHCWIGVDGNGDGPVDLYEQAHRWICWCGILDCELPETARPW